MLRHASYLAHLFWNIQQRMRRSVKRRMSTGKLGTMRRKMGLVVDANVTQILSTWREKRGVVWQSGLMWLGVGPVPDEP